VDESTAFFRERYASEDQRDLARLMRELAAAVARQCVARRNRSSAAIEVIRQSFYSRLIGAPEREA
jgi:hypothetical protein